jgi:hypothetical protein
MSKKEYKISFVVGDEYTNGDDVVKIKGFKDDYVVVNDGRDFDMHMEVKDFVSDWWKVEE